MAIIAAMITLLASLLLAVAPARAQSTATLRGVDVYRSTVLSVHDAREKFGGRLSQIVALRNQHRPASNAKADKVREEIDREAAKIPGIAFARLSISEHFTSVDHSMYATFDIVDESDRGRLAFSLVPKKTVVDPAGLLGAWKAYYDLGSVLSRRGQMPVDRPNCPGFYCLWGAATPELDELQKKFVGGAATKERELRTALSYEIDPERRAAALFVLSYGAHAEKVIESCHAGLKDPSPVVRGAALQILADIINHRQDLRVDASPILPLLDDPVSSVRGKTLGLLVPLVDDKAQREKILQTAPRLLVILRLSEPASHDLAFTVLGQLSQKAFDRRDYAAWQKWADANIEGLKK